MEEAHGSSGVSVTNDLVAEVVAQQLESMLAVGNYDGVKLLLAPVQPVDVAEAIGCLPRTLQALAFRLLGKDEAIEVYEYLEPTIQQSLLERLRSSEVLELVEEMSPDDRVRLLDELPAKLVRRLLVVVVCASCSAMSERLPGIKRASTVRSCISMKVASRNMLPI